MGSLNAKRKTKGKCLFFYLGSILVKTKSKAKRKTLGGRARAYIIDADLVTSCYLLLPDVTMILPNVTFFFVSLPLDMRRRTWYCLSAFG